MTKYQGTRQNAISEFRWGKIFILNINFLGKCEVVAIRHVMNTETRRQKKTLQSYDSHTTVSSSSPNDPHNQITEFAAVLPNLITATADGFTQVN